MARYIDADKIIYGIRCRASQIALNNTAKSCIDATIKLLQETAAIEDVVEVVRCKDCVHLYKEKMLCTCEHNRIFNTSKPTFSNCYCSYGERR